MKYRNELVEHDGFHLLMNTLKKLFYNEKKTEVSENVIICTKKSVFKIVIDALVLIKLFLSHCALIHSPIFDSQGCENILRRLLEVLTFFHIMSRIFIGLFNKFA